MESITHDLATVMAFLEACGNFVLRTVLVIWAFELFGIAILAIHFRKQSRRDQKGIGES